MVFLNQINLDDLKKSYGSPSKFDEEELRKWEQFENNVLEKNIILKIISETFDWKFLGM